MVGISKVVGVLSCGFLLYLGLTNAAQASYGGVAADEINAGQTDSREGGQTAQKEMDGQMKSDHSKGSHMIVDKLVCVEGENYFVKGRVGTEVRVYTDRTSQVIGHNNQEDRIQAGVNDKDYALWIRTESLDRRNEADTPTAYTLQSDKTDSMGQ